MSKLAKVDASAMNHLYAKEAARTGVKIAADDPQAFKDHKEYIETVDAVMKEDRGQAWNPNDPLLD